MTTLCKIKHKPTNLYYCPAKEITYSSKTIKTNLCKVGKLFFGSNLAQGVINQIKEFGNHYCLDHRGVKINDSNELVIEKFGCVKLDYANDQRESPKGT